MTERTRIANGETRKQILQWLKAGPASTIELAEAIGAHRTTVASACTKMQAENEIVYLGRRNKARVFGLDLGQPTRPAPETPAQQVAGRGEAFLAILKACEGVPADEVDRLLKAVRMVLLG